MEHDSAPGQRLNPTAVLSGPLWAAGDEVMGDGRHQAGDAYDMVRVRLDGHPLTATAAVA